MCSPETIPTKTEPDFALIDDRPVTIQDVIHEYKADFAQRDADERYKWEAVFHYQKNWNLEAADFAEMVAEAFRKAANLLTSYMYYPYQALCELSKAQPELVRGLFRQLYNEELPFLERYQSFRTGFGQAYQELTKTTMSGRNKPLNHYQDLHSVSVYVFFQYPKKYYIYKYKMYHHFQDLIGFTPKQTEPFLQQAKHSGPASQEPSGTRPEIHPDAWKLEQYRQLCEQVLQEAEADPELLSLHAARLPKESCYQDSACHLLVADLIYFGSKLAEGGKDLAGTTPVYWPSPEEYDPGISREQWKNLLQNDELTSAEHLTIFKMLLKLGGESTCANLSEIYGKMPNYYNRLCSSYAERIQKQLSCPVCIDEGVVRYFPILFTGRFVIEKNKKRYSWRLRDELRQALEDLDLSQIPLKKEDGAFTGQLAETAVEAVAETLSTVSARPNEPMDLNRSALSNEATELHTASTADPSTDASSNSSAAPFTTPAISSRTDGTNTITSQTDGTSRTDAAPGSQTQPLRPIYPNTNGDTETDVPKNLILYGPPGTGKTYSTVLYAVAAIENRPLESVKSEEYSHVLARFQAYKADGLIELTTFHQSYGYEEFIEGIRPVMEDGREDEENGTNADIQYEITPGLFQSFCERTALPDQKTDGTFGLNHEPAIWKVSLEGTGNNPTREECMKNGHIRIGWDGYGEHISSATKFVDGGKKVLNAFLSRMKQGDLVLSCFSNTTIDAIGVITGDAEWHKEYSSYKRLRKVNWLVKQIEEDITEINGGRTLTLSTVYKLSISLSDVMDIVKKHQSFASVHKRNHVFIIDEINRGNISKIFGELITLIEPSKRVGQPEEMKIRLPYSKKWFGVPDNIFLIGTMNTADRSIATLDTALRRRFQFREMQPDASVLAGIKVEGISISDLLLRMNRRISVLYDREHTIGHSYFMPLKKAAKGEPLLPILADIFANSILPLLQEYFYEDYEKIRLVLGDNQKENREDQFIVETRQDYGDLFGTAEYEFDETSLYEINREAFSRIEAYRYL